MRTSIARRCFKKVSRLPQPEGLASAAGRPGHPGPGTIWTPARSPRFPPPIPGEWPRVNGRATPRSHATARTGRHQRGNSKGQHEHQERPQRCHPPAYPPGEPPESARCAGVARRAPGGPPHTARGKPAEACLPPRKCEPISPFCASELIVAKTADLAPNGGSARFLLPLSIAQRDGAAEARLSARDCAVDRRPVSPALPSGP